MIMNIKLISLLKKVVINLILTLLLNRLPTVIHRLAPLGDRSRRIYTLIVH